MTLTADPAAEPHKASRNFYAHSARADRKDWQLLRDHLMRVAALAFAFAEAFPAPGLAHVAGLLHDLGKYTEEVQRRVAGENIRVEHAIQGARQVIERYGEKLSTLLAYIIAGHHAGLPNGRDTRRHRPRLAVLNGTGAPNRVALIARNGCGAVSGRGSLRCAVHGADESRSVRCAGWVTMGSSGVFDSRKDGMVGCGHLY